MIPLLNRQSALAQGENEMRYKAERSGAVLDTKTGLREWFDSHNEAIAAAASKNKGA